MNITDFSQIFYIFKSSLEFLCVLINAFVSLENLLLSSPSAAKISTEAGLCGVQPAPQNSGERESYSPHTACQRFHSEANNFITRERDRLDETGTKSVRLTKIINFIDYFC